MKINPEIFKAYDIRGIYGEDLTDEIAYRLGRAFAQLRREELGKEKPKFAVGADMRLSSPALKMALIKGLIEDGADVVDIGLVSTPTFYFGVAHFGYDGGIVVSASHNPKEWNGFKLVREQALPVSGDTGIQKLYQLVNDNSFEPVANAGKITKNDSVLEAQIEHDLKFADLPKIKPLKIVADAANSMGAQYLDAMFEKLPCKFVKMNFELDGTFPAHEADPLKEENLEDLKRKVAEEKAAFGIATDGDGDRVFFVDNESETIPQAIIRGLLAKIFLRERPGSKICYDIRPGRITRDMIQEAGGIPVVTKVGHSLIKEQTIQEGAYFAGESSGHFFLNLDIGCFEVPLIVILKLLEEFSQAGKPVSEYIQPYKKYWHSGEINSVVENKDAVFAKIEETYKDAEISKLDGITVEYHDFWFNVRGSNTEPKIRLNLEAVSKEIMEAKRDEVLKLIRT